MKVVANHSHVKEDLVIDLPVSDYRHGGVQVVWSPLGGIDGYVTLQSDVDGDGIWQEILSTSLDGGVNLNFRFANALPPLTRVKLDLRSGALERFSVFIVGKEKKHASKNN